MKILLNLMKWIRGAKMTQKNNINLYFASRPRLIQEILDLNKEIERLNNVLDEYTKEFIKLKDLEKIDEVMKQERIKGI